MRSRTPPESLAEFWTGRLPLARAFWEHAVVQGAVANLGDDRRGAPGARARLARPVIGIGGLLSIGETLVEVPLASLLGSESFIVLPVTIPQKQFAARGS